MVEGPYRLVAQGDSERVENATYLLTKKSWVNRMAGGRVEGRVSEEETGSFRNY